MIPGSTLLGALVVLLLVSVDGRAQTPPPDPVIARFGIVHGASNGPAILPVLPRGGIFLVRGAWLGPDDLVVAEQAFETELASSQLEIRSVESGVVYHSDMIHAWAFQVAGIMPTDVPRGLAEITVVYQGRRSEAVEIELVDSLPGLFAVSQQGHGPGVIQNFVSPTEQSLNSLTNPALPRQFIILWGTGLGPDATLEKTAVTIGADVFGAHYAGPAPGLPGVDQFNVKLPNSEDLPRGCYVPISVAGDRGSAGGVSVAISDTAGTCNHPWGLPRDTLVALDRGERIKSLEVVLSDSEFIVPPGIPQPLTRRQVSMTASPELLNATGVAFRSPTTPSREESVQSFCGSTSSIWINGVFGPSPPLPRPPSPPNPPALSADGGDALEFLGPGGRRIELRKLPPPDGFEGPSPFDPYNFRQPAETDLIAAGSWSLESRGGADLDPFSVNVDLVTLPTIETPLSIDFKKDITIEWSPEGFEPEDTIQLMVGVYVTTTTEDPPGSSSIIRGARCVAAAIDGKLTVPLETLSDVPAVAEELAVWQISLNANRILQSPQFDHATFSLQISRADSIPIEP